MCVCVCACVCVRVRVCVKGFNVLLDISILYDSPL